MDILQRHEVFEIEVLDRLNRSGMLEPLVFGGGSMLRLCHELNRYSVDLDFWFIKKVREDRYFNDLHDILKKQFEITDEQIKHYTIIFELRSPLYPRRLKIEIRRGQKTCDFQRKIAFSGFSTRQVLLRAHTLYQTMKNKVDAFLDRAEIRDCFDIEFLLRRGIDLPEMTDEESRKFEAGLNRFKDRDFKVTLGSILEPDMREYYAARGFSYLKEKLNAQ
ncbi:MAG: nucleotidyl transferase AbiEii/AbiGii toxin family protein [Desulfobacterales bacterium]